MIKSLALKEWHPLAISLGLMATALIAAIVSTVIEYRIMELGISFVLGACAALTTSTWAAHYRKRSIHTMRDGSLNGKANGEQPRYLG